MRATVASDSPTGVTSESTAPRTYSSSGTDRTRPPVRTVTVSGTGVEPPIGPGKARLGGAQAATRTTSAAAVAMAMPRGRRPANGTDGFPLMLTTIGPGPDSYTT